MAATGRTGFRPSSNYHEKCISESLKRIQSIRNESSTKNYPTSVYRDCNQVAQEKVWKEQVRKEKSAKKSWEDNWGFTVNYNQKGEVKVKRDLPENISYYKSSLPRATNEQYGSRLHSSSGIKMMQLDIGMSKRKAKTNITALPWKFPNDVYCILNFCMDVERLKDKLTLCIEDDLPNEKILKILKKLEAVDMTVDILQETRIGRIINKLRKNEGEVGRRALELVKKWKSLVPERKQDVPSTYSSPKCVPTQEAPLTRHGDITCTSTDRHSSNLTDTPTSSINFLQAEEKRSKKLTKSILQKRFAQPNAHKSQVTHNQLHPPSREQSRSPSPVHHKVSPRKQVPLPREQVPRLDVSSINTDDVSMYSQLYSSDSDSGRKRKGATMESQVAVGSSKRSRTQVYAGEANTLKSVPSLFDSCMRVLSTNIDAIEEVGYLDFHVLKPLLEKCTASQLKRLEKFNPHLIEDNDVLWKKHCSNKFKAAVPQRGQTWKELFLLKEHEEESKLKHLSTFIQAKKSKEEEAKRTAKLTATPLSVPGRHRGGGFFSVRGHSNHSRSAGSFHRNKEDITPLMKLTKKMAQQRSKMMGGVRRW